MKKEYRHLSTWAEKASYLEGLLTPGLEHKEPKVINITHCFVYRFLFKIMIIKNNDQNPVLCVCVSSAYPVLTDGKNRLWTQWEEERVR